MPTPVTEESENNYSVAMMITFGNLRIVDFADLTTNPGERLTCPFNNLGTVDIYMTARHGGWNPPEIVHALRPRVAIMNNARTHWGSVENWVSFHTSPRFEDLWQLRWSELGGADHNSEEKFIVNPSETAAGRWVEVTATADGAFTARNSRNGFEKKYPAPGK
jgi:hypothetical protein